MKKILVLLTICAFFLGFRMQPLQADEGCPVNQTRRATALINVPGYPTCAFFACSGYNWTKIKSHVNLNNISQPLVIDYAYSLQGGSYSGLPACRPEINDISGWVYNGG